MRSVVVFEVSGRSLEELNIAAAERWKDINGDDAAVLPPNTHVDICPLLVVIDGEIQPSEDRWSAKYTISVQLNR